MIRMQKKIVAVVLSGCTFLASATAGAAPIQATNVTASSTFFSYDLANLTNGNGLSGDLHEGAYGGKWMTADTNTGWLLFDFGSTRSLASTTIWNYGPGCCDGNRSTKDLGISYSYNNVDFFDLGDVVLDNPGQEPFGGQLVDLQIDARYIKFSLNSNYGADWIGLAEVRFEEASGAVPEPATASLFGLALTGLLLSRRKRAKR